jgi:hypothetical protein
LGFFEISINFFCTSFLGDSVISALENRNVEPALTIMEAKNVGKGVIYVYVPPDFEDLGNLLERLLICFSFKTSLLYHF